MINQEDVKYRRLVGCPLAKVITRLGGWRQRNRYPKDVDQIYSADGLFLSGRRNS